MKKSNGNGLLDVESYLARVPEPARSTLMRIRAAIRFAVPPGTTEAISYGVPTFQYQGALVGFAAFSRHCSFFPMSVAVMEAFADDVKEFPTSKGTIRFPIDKPLPSALVKKLVKARVVENESRHKR